MTFQDELSLGAHVVRARFDTDLIRSPLAKLPNQPLTAMRHEYK